MNGKRNIVRAYSIIHEQLFVKRGESKIVESSAERVILHVDMNNFYASCECRVHPGLAVHPVAVCGSVEERHGIVLAKNQLAKEKGVMTGDAIWQAKQKCRELVTIAPHFDLYLRFSQAAREIYEEYTDQVEPFGLDECFLDVTASTRLFGSGEEIAHQIRNRIRRELGVTVSVGVSFCKVFAKLGSDLKKPDAVTVIPYADFRRIVWPLPADSLVGIGRATRSSLKRYGIHTVGQLAQMPHEFLRTRFGKNGEALRRFANGEDTSPVLPCDIEIPAKSVGHGTTVAHDLITPEQVWQLILELSQSVAHSLRVYGKRASGISVRVRDSDLQYSQSQTQLAFPTSHAADLAHAAFALFSSFYEWKKDVRAVTVTAVSLVGADLPMQMGMFYDGEAQRRSEQLDTCVDAIRDRYGFCSIRPAILLDRQILSPTEKVNTFRGRVGL